MFDSFLVYLARYLSGSFITSVVGGLASLTPYLLQTSSLFCYLTETQRNPTMLQEFVPLTCNYRSNKRQFSLLPSNLRGRPVSYHLSIILCVDLCNNLFIYNKLSHIFMHSVFYYQCEQLRAHRPDK